MTQTEYVQAIQEFIVKMDSPEARDILKNFCAEGAGRRHRLKMGVALNHLAHIVHEMRPVVTSEKWKYDNLR